MKKIILGIFLVVIALTPCSVKAQEQVYSRALTTDTGFYSDQNGTYLKFYLPYGYYVKILENGSFYTKVMYMNENSAFPTLTGYIKNVDVITCDYIPSTPYPMLYVTLCEDEVLFSDSQLNVSKVGVYAETSAVYYGEITNSVGVELVYVYCNGYLGYVRKSAFYPFEVPKNPQPIEQVSASSPTQSKKSGGNELQLLVVAGISVIVVTFVYMIFRPGEKKTEKQPNRYYDEE